MGRGCWKCLRGCPGTENQASAEHNLSLLQWISVFHVPVGVTLHRIKLWVYSSISHPHCCPLLMAGITMVGAPTLQEDVRGQHCHLHRSCVPSQAPCPTDFA